MRTVSLLAASLLLVTSGCSGSQHRADETSKPAPRPPVSAELPANTFAVAIIRSPVAIGELATRSMLGDMAPERAAKMLAEVRQAMQAEVGLDPTGATVATVFAILSDGKPKFGVLVRGVTGTPSGSPVGQHAGVAVFQPAGDDLRLATHDNLLVLGNAEAVNAALEVVAGGAVGLAPDSTLGRLLAETDGDATFLVALDPSVVPDPEFQQVVGSFGVQGLYLVYEPSEIRAVAQGDPIGLKRLQTLLEQQLQALVAESRAAKDQVAGEGLALQLVAIITYYQAEEALVQLSPVLDSDHLMVRASADLGDTGLVVAAVGIVAAVAIPAFMKYTKKSKTTEARQLTKKLHEGARAHYLDTKTFPPSTPLTPPNPTACCEKCAPDARLWTNESWIALGFSVDDPHYYSYQYIRTPDGLGFTARAHGDLDCDGQWSTFEMYGTVNSEYSDDASGNSGLYRQDELQ